MQILTCYIAVTEKFADKNVFYHANKVLSSTRLSKNSCKKKFKKAKICLQSLELCFLFVLVYSIIQNFLIKHHMEYSLKKIPC